MARILLGVSGSIAAYKAIDLTSKLVQKNHDVRAILTRSACEFVQPLSFHYISRKEPVLDSFSQEYNLETDHIALADWVEVFVVAPATANVIGKLAGGLADDNLTTIALALPPKVPCLLAPAMNHRMLSHPAVEKNLALLKERDYHIVDSEAGHLACGHTGAGRLADPERIANKIEALASGIKKS